MPDTTNYMILGYAVTIAILTGIVVYLVLKARNLRAELQTLEMLDAEDKSKEAESATSPARETLPKQVEHPNMPA